LSFLLLILLLEYVRGLLGLGWLLLEYVRGKRPAADSLSPSQP